MDGLLSLLRSRKFWVALLTIVGMVSVALGREDVPVEALADAIATIVAVWLGAVAVEDAARKLSGGG